MSDERLRRGDLSLPKEGSAPWRKVATGNPLLGGATFRLGRQASRAPGMASTFVRLRVTSTLRFLRIKLEWHD